MASTQNNFNKGLNSDIVKTQFNAQQYVKALNMRLTNIDELTTGSLNNILGNKSFSNMNFPNEVFSSIKIENNSENDITPVPTTITINGNSTTLYIGGATTGEDIKLSISTLPGYNADFEVYTYENTCIIKGLTVNPSVSTTINPNLILSQWSNYIDFRISRLTIIGSTYINNDIYLLTTVTDNEPGGDGLIWKFSYDESLLNFNSNVKLIYHSTDLRFCKQHPIFNECKGNYENINVQKIYWTDEYNSLRNLNVADINCFATPTNIINTQPKTNLKTLKLKNILDTGSLYPGYYMLTYRYGSSSGATTPFSNVTPAIPIIISQESENQLQYTPFPTNSSLLNKSIVVTIDDVDTNFTFIEAAYLYYSPGSSSPQVRLFKKELILGSSIDITLSDFYSGEAITLQDLNISNVSFDTVGTIEVKDNRLAVGRVKLSNATNLDYDFRAYRFPSRHYSTKLPANHFNWNGSAWDKCIVKDSQGNKTVFDTSLANWGLNDKHDAITPRQAGYDIISYNSLTEGVTDPNLSHSSYPTVITEDKVNYKFQSDGLTIGGEGPNVSYKFFNYSSTSNNESLIGDDIVTLANTRSEYVPTITEPYYKLNNVKYPWKRNNNYSRGYAYHRFNGFQFEETYRFGAELVDKQGNVLFTKWIGDIKFPSATEIKTMFGAVIYNYYNHTSIDVVSSNTQYLHPLGIEFTFNNLDKISDKIGSIRIVYVERKDIDKTILASGLIFPFESTDPASRYITYSGPINRNKITFDSPDLMYDFSKALPGNDTSQILPGYQFNKTNIDNLLVIGRLRTNNSIGIGSSTLIKTYDYKYRLANGELARQKIKIESATYDNKINEIIFGTSGSDTTNSEIVTASTTISLSDNYNKSNTPGYGLKCTNNHGDIRDDYSPLLGLYHRQNPNQYGGKGYSARAQNTYKHTGFEIFINNNNIETLKVLGGDVCYPIWDYKKSYTLTGLIYSISYAAPLPLQINTELREAIHPFVIGSLPTSQFDSLNIPVYYTEPLNYTDPNPAVPEPFGYDNPTEFLQRVYISELKYPGEFGESWGVFKSSNYRDLDGLYGPVRKLINWQDQLTFLQDLAIGILPVNARAFQTDASASTIITGSGEILSKHVYKSTNSGTIHQHSVISTPSAVYYYDKNQRNLTAFNGQINPISLLGGMQSWFRKNLNGAINIEDNSIWINPKYNTQVGISSTYDYKYGQVLFTFHIAEEDPLNPSTYLSKKYTLAYNDRLKCYESFYSYTPLYYINNGRKIFTQNPNVTSTLIYMHDEGEYNKFYNIYSPSEVEFIVNNNPNITKVFDNLYIQTECYNPLTNDDEPFDTFTELTCYTDYQETNLEPLIVNSNIKRRERSWFTRVPRDKNTPAYTSLKPRLRDKYMKIKLTYLKNLGDYNRLIFHNCNTDFRISIH